MEDLNNVLRVQEYINKMHPVFNKRALYSDETAQYRTPMEPGTGRCCDGSIPDDEKQCGCRLFYQRRDPKRDESGGESGRI